jgi:hypothetical protein
VLLPAERGITEDPVEHLDGGGVLGSRSHPATVPRCSDNQLSPCG